MRASTIIEAIHSPRTTRLPYVVPVTTQKIDKTNNEVSHPGTRSGRGRRRRLLLLVLPTTRRVPKSRERSQAHERRGQDGVTRHHHDHVDAEDGEDVHAEGGEDVHAQGREGRCYSPRCGREGREDDGDIDLQEWEDTCSQGNQV